VPTPRHVTTWRDLTLPELQDALSLVLERRAAMQRDGRYVHVFVNDGAAAGASVSHVHAQLVSLDRSEQTDALVDGVRDRGSCALCELLTTAPELLVQRGNHHALLAHPVPRLGGGLLLFPLEHREAPVAARLAEFAELMHRAIAALDAEVDANYWFVADEQQGAHWYVELQPRTSGLAGVEVALGTNISTATAAATAERARERLAMHS
jgi:UDPglucose--hexose-1-phosphate uridylyltransferase